MNTEKLFLAMVVAGSFLLLVCIERFPRNETLRWLALTLVYVSPIPRCVAWAIKIYRNRKQKKEEVKEFLTCVILKV